MAAQAAPGAAAVGRHAAEPVTYRTYVALLCAAGAYTLFVVCGWVVTTRWSGFRFGTVAILAGAVVSTAGASWAATRTSGAERRWRLLFALVLAGAVYGQFVWTWYIYVDGVIFPGLSPVAVGYLAATVIALAALAAFPSTVMIGGAPGGAVSVFRWPVLAILDALVVVVSLFLLAWSTALGTVVDAAPASTEQFAIAVAYPCSAFVLVVFMLLRGLFRRPDNPRAQLLVAFGLGCVALSASALVALVVNHGEAVTPFVNLGMVAGPLLVALGTVAPPPPGPRGAARLVGTARPRARLALWGRLVLPYLPVLGILAVLSVDLAWGDRIGADQLGPVFAVLLLVVLRQVLTVFENAQLSRRVHDAQRDLVDQARTLVRRGDAAVYAARRRGRGRLATQGSAAPAEHLDPVLPDLEFALAGDESAGVLETFYQPVVSLLTGRTVAYEALARWTHPTRGAVSPSHFVPLAEGAGLVPALDAIMIDQACADVAALRARCPESADAVVHVNVSAVWAGKQDLVDTVVADLAQHGLPPSALVVEITETFRIADMAAVAAVMGTLARRGVGLALDDVGAGYSSVASLHVLPFSMVKLDASLTATGAPPKTVALRNGIVRLARALDLTVIAEGVETAAQAAALTRIGCHLGQGYLYGVPVPIRKIIDGSPAA